MGLLDARIDAEKIGFPAVGEAEKDASNVIDYNIREEQTIDNFSVINANNQTTTGMATVIPGLNTNKLIAKTSIIGSEDTRAGGALLSSNVWARSDHGGTEYANVTQFTITNETGDLQYVQGTDGIIIPKTATYNLAITYPTGTGSVKFDIYIKDNSDTIHEYHGGYNNTPYSDSMFAHLNKGDKLRVYAVVTFINPLIVSQSISINILSIT